MLKTLFGASMAGALMVCLSAGAHARDLDGLYNTGPSRKEAAQGASLNISFHSCADDPALICAKVIDVIEPNGPSGNTILPDGAPVIGYEMIRGLESKGGGKYRGGKIASLDESMIEGKMLWYGLKIDDLFDGTLEAKGCVGIICPRTMIWTRVDRDAAESDSER